MFVLAPPPPKAAGGCPAAQSTSNPLHNPSGSAALPLTARTAALNDLNATTPDPNLPLLGCARVLDERTTESRSGS